MDFHHQVFAQEGACKNAAFEGGVVFLECKSYSIYAVEQGYTLADASQHSVYLPYTQFKPNAAYPARTVKSGFLYKRIERGNIERICVVHKFVQHLQHQLCTAGRITFRVDHDHRVMHTQSAKNPAVTAIAAG